jgi:cell division protein ZapA (FtsZ GTPase activity inhibitor)
MNDIYSDINARIVNMETTKDINLESVTSYFTNKKNCLQHNSAYFEQIKIAFETALNVK